jgi:UDP-3-O-[3-hydroxymyristoyl] glucosamine N-acyltransferase
MGEFMREVPQPATVDALVARVAQAATIAGAGGRLIRGIAPLSPGQEGALSFCDPGGSAERVRESRSAVIAVASGADFRPAATQTLVGVEDPRAWFIRAVETLLPAAARPAEPAVGISSGATVHPSAQVAASAAIGSGVHIGAGTRIGGSAVLYTGSVVGANCCIGPGTVIGWVGLAYHEDRHGQRLFFPHLGGVRIGDWVDIGANCCICQGILSDTTISDQAKLGSLVYVGHGVVIEEKVWISASTAIAGHARIGEAGLIGIGTVVVDNVATGVGVLVGGGSAVTRSAEAGAKLVGVPAHPVPALRRFGPTPRT